MFRKIAVLLSILYAFSPTNPAAAQQACGDRVSFLNKLHEVFAENPVAMGLTEKGAVLEVFASQNGSWTFLVTLPGGKTCVVASGKNWETLAEVEAGLAS